MEPEKKIESAKGQPNIKIIETYAEDMAKVIGDDKEGLIKKIIHGEEEHELEKKNLSPESKKNKLFMLISIVLIVLAVITLSFFLLKKDNNTIPVARQFVPIIFNDHSTFVEVSGLKKEEITQTIFNDVNNTEVKIGGVDGIYLTENKQIVGLRRFIALIKGNFVPGDNALFVSDNFMMGAVHTGLKSTSPTAGDFFILLKVRSTLDVFGAMRSWEDKMLTDLHGFFGINISSDTNYLFTKNFEDGIIENKNARILYDKDGGIVVMYVFADDNSVIITNSQPAAHEIVLRLASSQKEQ